MSNSDTLRPYKLIGCVQHDCEACITRENQYKERCAELSAALEQKRVLEEELIKVAFERNDALADAEANRRNAERYRWLKLGLWSKQYNPEIYEALMLRIGDPSDVDAAIDDAMREAGHD